jgi:hypothetical protein
VVLPKNKDVADYLGYDPIGADVSESSRRAGVAELPLKPGQPTAARVLYIGEELLREDAKIILQHELLHVFEERYATDEELDVIDAAHERARAAKGPYPSLYGAERREFLTTLGEEYLNSRGPEGRAWVQHHYPEVYGILDRLLG